MVIKTVKCMQTINEEFSAIFSDQRSQSVYFLDKEPSFLPIILNRVND